MAEFDSDVVFSPGAPLDVNKLNQLQANIRSVYDETRSLNTTITTIGNIQKTTPAVPVIEVGTATVKINGNTTAVSLENEGFSSTAKLPTVVATILDDLKPNVSYSIRAKATNAKRIIIEVTSTDKTVDKQEINVNYTAIQMVAKNN